MRGRGRVHKTERWHAVLSLVRGEIPNGSYWVESQMPANDSIRSEPYLAYPGDNTFKKMSLGDSNRNAFEKQNHRGTRQTACRLDFGKQFIGYRLCRRPLKKSTGDDFWRPWLIWAAACKPFAACGWHWAHQGSQSRLFGAPVRAAAPMSRPGGGGGGSRSNLLWTPVAACGGLWRPVAD